MSRKAGLASTATIRRRGIEAKLEDEDVLDFNVHHAAVEGKTGPRSAWAPPNRCHMGAWATPFAPLIQRANLSIP